MSFETLGSRMKKYEECSDYSLIQRTPIIIRIDGRSFSKLTKNLPKPFCQNLQHIFHNTMLYCAPEIQGLVIAYHQSDEITFILRNDQALDTQPWFDNRINKITSITAAIATLGFNKLLQDTDPKIDLCGEAVFDARVFQVPDLTEACNNLVWRQQDCIKNAITSASQFHLVNKFGKRTALKMLHKKISSEKKKLLLNECGIDFDEHYSSAFRLGAAIYKIPMIISIPGKEEPIYRDKWSLNTNLPVFTQDKDLIPSILINRRDIFRGASVSLNTDGEEK